MWPLTLYRQSSEIPKERWWGFDSWMDRLAVEKGGTCKNFLPTRLLADGPLICITNFSFANVRKMRISRKGVKHFCNRIYSTRHRVSVNLDREYSVIANFRALVNSGLNFQFRRLVDFKYILYSSDNQYSKVLYPKLLDLFVPFWAVNSDALT